MHPDLQKINEAAEGLLYLSESDFPFETVHISEPPHLLEDVLIQMTACPTGTPVTKTTLAYFFRNVTKKKKPGSLARQNETAGRFLHLQNLLQEKLSGVEVYRIGTLQIEIFIIGKLSDGTYAGLRTKAIET